jgi:hypothetical protein
VSLTTKIRDRRLVSILTLLLSHEQMKLLARALAALDNSEELRDVAEDIVKTWPVEQIEQLADQLRRDLPPTPTQIEYYGFERLGL